MERHILLGHPQSRTGKSRTARFRTILLVSTRGPLTKSSESGSSRFASSGSGVSHFIIMESEKVDTAYSLQLAFAQATSLLPFFLFIVFVSSGRMVISRRLSLGEGLQKVQYLLLTVHDMY